MSFHGTMPVWLNYGKIGLSEYIKILILNIFI
jgi:hypothetical protein